MGELFFEGDCAAVPFCLIFKEEKMHPILTQIKRLIADCLKEKLPHIKLSELEENGAVYYMNGKDGTEFEWFVNNKLPPFMVFYDDKENLGAVKFSLYKDINCTASVILYDEHGKKPLDEVIVHVNTTKKELLELAVILKNIEDDNKHWDMNIDLLDTDLKPAEEQVREFIDRRPLFDKLIESRRVLNLHAIVSRQIARDGWKIGFMQRENPQNEQDSGWIFYSGREDDNYTADPKNFVVAEVGYVCNYWDNDAFKLISSPVGSRFIRVSETEFIPDDNKMEIFSVKR